MVDGELTRRSGWSTMPNCNFQRQTGETCMTASAPPPAAPTQLSEDAFQELLVSPPGRRRSRWLIWLLALGGSGGLVCFSGCLIFSLICEAKRVTAPADVLHAAQEITDLTLPEDFEGELAETVVTPIFVVRKAQFRHVSGKGVLSLVSIKVHWLSRDDEAEATRSGLEQLAGEMHQIVADEESTRSMTIRDAPSEFRFRSGTDALSSTKYREVRGEFRGKTGAARLWLQAEQSVWDAAGIERMLDSL